MGETLKCQTTCGVECQNGHDQTARLLIVAGPRVDCAAVADSLRPMGTGPWAKWVVLQIRAATRGQLDTGQKLRADAEHRVDELTLADSIALRVSAIIRKRSFLNVSRPSDIIRAAGANHPSSHQRVA